MPDHYVCGVDIHRQRQLLLAAGVCSDNGKRFPPCIGVFSQKEKWQRKYAWQSIHAKLDICEPGVPDVTSK